jgi:hypothetical protein
MHKNMSQEDIKNKFRDKGYKISQYPDGLGGIMVTDRFGNSMRFPSLVWAFRYYFSSVY